MAFLFTSSTANYAEEKLFNHLSALSTLSVSLPPSSTPSSSSQSRVSRASPTLDTALHELSASRPLTLEKLADVLQSLSKPRNQGLSAEYAVDGDVDKLVEAEVMARAVTMVWKEVMQVLLDGALALEEERSWWDASLNTRRGVGIYLVQSTSVGCNFRSSQLTALPHRIVRTLPPASSLRTFRFPPPQALFRQPSAAITTAITSPYTLTRREMLSSRKSLTMARDIAARRIGLLASQGPQWSADSNDAAAQSSSPSELQREISRIYGVLCDVLEVPPPTAPSSKRSRSSISTLPSTGSYSAASASALLTVLTAHVPRARQAMDKTLASQRRPSALTRLWFPLLFLPPVLWIASSSLLRNKDWMKAQLRNGRETIQGFVVQWVWEPLEGIGKTLRGGGEGLGVAPTTVKSDQDVSGPYSSRWVLMKQSLERMVLDLGRDYYHLSGPALTALGEKVRNGDMEEVLRVYEKEMTVCLWDAQWYFMLKSSA